MYAAVHDLQHGKCLFCGNGIAHYHHVAPRHLGGSNTLKNIVGLCESCHGKIHTNQKIAAQLSAKQAGLYKRYGALSVLNQAIPYICRGLVQLFGDDHVSVTQAKTTARIRKNLGFCKTKESQLHEVDAYCIGLDALGNMPDAVPEFAHTYRIKQFRRHDRSIINSQRERTYKLDGTTIAKNRKPRFEQSGDSLFDWHKKQMALFGKQAADAMRSQLTVTKSVRHYNNTGRFMPGTIFCCRGQQYIMSGQFSGGQYLRAYGDTKTNYPAKNCRIMQQNTGLVFIC